MQTSEIAWIQSRSSDKDQHLVENYVVENVQVGYLTRLRFKLTIVR